MKAEASENAGVHRRLRGFKSILSSELRRDASFDLQAQDRGVQSERRLECVTDSGYLYDKSAFRTGFQKRSGKPAKAWGLICVGPNTLLPILNV